MVTGSWGRVSVPPEHRGLVIPPSLLRQHPCSSLGRTQLPQTRVPLQTPTLCVRSVQEFMTFTSQLIVERSALGSRASVKEQGERITRGSARAAARKGRLREEQGPARLLPSGFLALLGTPGAVGLRARRPPFARFALARAAAAIQGAAAPAQPPLPQALPCNSRLLPLSLASPPPPLGSAFQALGRAGCGLELAAAASLMTTLRPVMSCYLL